MISFFRKLLRSKAGNALVIAGAALPLVIGSAGLASDTIQWTLWKRQLQRAADSAALAGVYGEMGSQNVTDAVNRDLSLNYRLWMTRTNTSIQHAPTSGAYTADANAVRVVLSVQQQLAFSGLFLSTAPTITASATATITQTGKYCVISLENTTATGLTFSGSANVNLGCGMATNSKGNSAIDAGGSSTITSSPVAAVGAIPSSTNFASGTTMQPYSAPQKDPFAAVNPPTVPNGCNQAALQGNAHSVTASNTTVCYTNLTLNSSETATFTDATIILNGGNLKINAGATLTCTRCTFILTTNNSPVTSSSIGNVTFNGGAHISLTAPTSGTYAGIVIYQDRRAPFCNNCNKINGDSTSYIEGAIYMPTQEIQFNGGSGLNSNCMQIVGRQVQFSGNTSITNTCPAGSGAHAWDGTSIRLVE